MNVYVVLYLAPVSDISAHIMNNSWLPRFLPDFTVENREGNRVETEMRAKQSVRVFSEEITFLFSIQFPHFTSWCFDSANFGRFSENLLFLKGHLTNYRIDLAHFCSSFMTFSKDNKKKKGDEVWFNLSGLLNWIDRRRRLIGIIIHPLSRCLLPLPLPPPHLSLLPALFSPHILQRKKIDLKPLLFFTITFISTLIAPQVNHKIWMTSLLLSLLHSNSKLPSIRDSILLLPTNLIILSLPHFINLSLCNYRVRFSPFPFLIINSN